jgi:hypothetical protein
MMNNMHLCTYLKFNSLNICCNENISKERSGEELNKHFNLFALSLYMLQF